jgi:predicted permease
MSMGQFLSVFINVVTPVFVVILVGYLAGPRLGLEVRTLSRVSYFVFMPAFVFDIVSEASIQAGLTARMTVYILAVYIGCALLAFGVAKGLGRSSEIVAMYVLIAVFSNSANFGLSMIKFRFGDEALVSGTIYFLALTLIGFVVGVAAASWARGGALRAILSVVKTPSLIAFVPAAFFSATHIDVPLFATRIVGLLADAMIPVMLVTLGVQLAEMGLPRISSDVVAASAVRLIGGPILAAIAVIPSGLIGLERSTGILQASMPAAVLTTIIAIEYDLVPGLVTTTVLFSTLASLITLTVVLGLV